MRLGFYRFRQTFKSAENRAVEGPRGLYQMGEGRSPPNHPGRPHSIKAQSSDGAFIIVFNEIRTGRGARGAAGRLRPWLTTWSGREIAPVADHVERRGQAPLRRLFYLGLCRLRGILSPPASTTVILPAGRSSVQQRCCSRRAVLLCRHEN